jgi:hypothetical protein
MAYFVVSTVGSDISFVFNRKSRLFSHKVFLHQFSTYFRPQLENSAKYVSSTSLERTLICRLKYIEIKQPEISIPAFTDYLKLLYNGFVHSAFDSKMDVQGIISDLISFIFL